MSPDWRAARNASRSTASAPESSASASAGGSAHAAAAAVSAARRAIANPPALPPSSAARIVVADRDTAAPRRAIAGRGMAVRNAEAPAVHRARRAMQRGMSRTLQAENLDLPAQRSISRSILLLSTSFTIYYLERHDWSRRASSSFVHVGKVGNQSGNRDQDDRLPTSNEGAVSARTLARQRGRSGAGVALRRRAAGLSAPLHDGGGGDDDVCGRRRRRRRRRARRALGGALVAGRLRRDDARAPDGAAAPGREVVGAR